MRLADRFSAWFLFATVAIAGVSAGIGLSLLAMGFAGAGYLPPVGGALLQEAIDVAVILNALRAL